jgi:hypothetical protein
MTNEQYLVVSYFTVGLLSFAFALATYLLLRHSFIGVTQAVRGKLSIILRRLFFIGIILPALVGFFSVSFRSCSKETYVQIIADRSYLVVKNQEQLSTSLSYIVIALLLWGLIILGAFIINRNHKIGESG